MAANVLPFAPRQKTQPAARLRSDVAPFDPTNPAHLRAWEAMWDLGMSEKEARDHGR